jgi:hypothetical protein
MHGHIQYVRKQLMRVNGGPLSEDAGIALRSMRTMLVNGLCKAEDQVERLHRIALVNEIDRHLNINTVGGN